MNIKILQAENSIENVDRSVISALYNAHINGDISLEVDNNNQKVGLIGSITAPAGYAILVSTLNSAYPKFHVTVNNEYISFEDANVELTLLNIGLGDGVGITVLAAGNANFTNNTFKNNTTITSFNEFSYFTRANVNPVSNLFEGCTNLEEVDLSLTTKISDGEFLSSGIKEVDAPALTEIGSNAFSRSSVETVTSLGNIANIPFGCFMYCNDLQTVQLPSTVTTISPEAFSPLNSGGISSLTYINLNNVTSIDNSAFINCKLLNIDASDLSNLVSIGEETFSSCFNIHGELNMPNLISAGNHCFNSCSRITKIKCLGKITAIPEFFMVKLFSSGMALTEVYLPYECTSILWNGFNGCSALTTIKQYTQSVDDWVNGEPSSYGRITRITTFGRLCFDGCSSLTITAEDIQNAVTIGMNAFLNSGLTGNLNLPNLTSLGSDAFNNTRISSIDLTGSTITSLPVRVFYNCTNLSKIKLPTTVTYLNELWSRNISSTLYISGLDNVSGHSTYNWDLYNTTILNPIKISLVTGGSIVCWSNTNSVVTRVHSYYEPLRTSTVQNSLVIYGAPKSTLFIYNCLGGTGSFTIGLLYYRDIASFGTATFFRCTIENLVINNSTPPVLDNSDTTFSGEYYWLNWGNSIFGNLNASSDAALQDHAIIGTLWVPDSAVATYQADPLYSSLTIKGINTKTNGVDYDLPRYANFAAWEAAEEAAVAQGGHAPLGLIEAWM